jgi:hypothetical protein
LRRQITDQIDKKSDRYGYVNVQRAVDKGVVTELPNPIVRKATR